MFRNANRPSRKRDRRKSAQRQARTRRLLVEQLEDRRMLAAGELDPTFDSDGLVTTPVGSGDDAAYGLAVQPDGRILVAGWSDNGSNDDFVLARYEAGGAPEIDVQRPAATSIVDAGTDNLGTQGVGTVNLTYTIYSRSRTSKAAIRPTT